MMSHNSKTSILEGFLVCLLVCFTIVPSVGGCDPRTKRDREELPHIRGQGQKPGGPHARGAAAKRSYPTTEVRGSGRERQAATAQEQPRGATLRPRSGEAAGGEKPHLQGVVAARAQEGLEKLFHVKVRGAAVRRSPHQR